VLEDLGHLSARDQLAACSPEEARDVLGRIARVHGAWWESERLDSHREWLPGPDSAYFDVIRHGYVDYAGRPGELADHVPSWVVELAQDIAGRYEVMFDRGAGRHPHTLLHGDFRLDNMLFGGPGSARPFVLLDWQLVMSLNPMFEVMYFCAGSLTVDVRRRHEPSLIEHYHASLRAAGVEGYTLDQCWADYRRASLGMLGYLVPLMGEVQLDHLNDRGRTMMLTLADRYAQAIGDHRDSDEVRALL
jgi:hypothetical protein